MKRENVMKNCTKLEKIAYLFKSTTQAPLDIIVKKLALAERGEAFKQKVFLFYPYAATAVPLQVTLNTDFFSIYAEIRKTK